MTVVTRFAPSPTGYLHIGGARTALFCWLYARHTGGKFLLRIEDTDKERSTQAAVDAIFDGLGWLGLAGDEPPVMQSTRAGRHREVAEALLESGSAFRCYLTSDELAELAKKREEERAPILASRDRLQVARNKLAHADKKAVPSLDTFLADLRLDFDLQNSSLDDLVDVASALKVIDRELALTQEKLRDLSGGFRSPYRDGNHPAPESGNAPYVVRLRMNDDNMLSIRDAVQDFVRVHSRQLDDLVLLRSDGSPTYMLAVVVDDHDMGVTHVIRGDDHLTNTFRQLPIMDAMKWDRPDYAHVPMIHGPDGKKLSKRHGATGVEAYRDELGYLPEGLKNYLLRLGWSHGDDEIIPEDKAIEWFDLDGLNRAPARLDLVKLNSINAHYMALADDQRLMDLFLARPEAKTFSATALERVRAAMGLLKTRSPNLVELAVQARFLGDIRPVVLSGKAADLVNDEAKVRLAGLAGRLKLLEGWTEPGIREVLTQYCADIGVGLGKIGPVLRAVLTGGAPSPDITLVLTLLGRNECLARIQDQAGETV